MHYKNVEPKKSGFYQRADSQSNNIAEYIEAVENCRRGRLKFFME